MVVNFAQEARELPASGALAFTTSDDVVLDGGRIVLPPVSAAVITRSRDEG